MLLADGSKLICCELRRVAASVCPNKSLKGDITKRLAIAAEMASHMNVRETCGQRTRILHII